jgi:hypothetical protein
VNGCDIATIHLAVCFNVLAGLIINSSGQASIIRHVGQTLPAKRLEEKSLFENQIVNKGKYPPPPASPCDLGKRERM